MGFVCVHVSFVFNYFLTLSYGGVCWFGGPGTDRSLELRHDTLLLRHIARDLLHALSLRRDDTWHGQYYTSQQC